MKVDLPSAHAVCPHDCPSVCTLEIEREGERLGRVRGSKANPYTAGVVCAKVARYAERFHHADRLKHPMRRVGGEDSGQFERIEWDDALDLIAESFLKSAQRYDSTTVWPYYYAGTMGLLQRDGLDRLRNAMGYSEQISTICTTLAKTGWLAGHGNRFGSDALKMRDSDLIVVWGGNMVASQVHVMSHIAVARKERGARLIVIDPYQTATARQADLHLAPRPGTDAALALGVMHCLFRDGLVDRAYIDANTDDPSGFEAHCQTRNVAWASAISGVPEADIEQFAQLYGRSQRSFLRAGYGFTRSENGSVAMHAVTCLPILVGAWAREGSGALWGHGDIYNLDTTLIEGSDLADPSIRAIDMCRIGPALTGDKRDLGNGPPVTAMIIQNCNPAVVAPDSNRVNQGLRRDDLFLCVHEQFMTDTAKLADVILPATMFLEHDDLYTASGHGRLQVSRKLFEPFAESRSNHEVVCALAKRLGAEHRGFELSAWAIIDETLKASGYPGAEQVALPGGVECIGRHETTDYRDGFGHADGRFHFRPRWETLGPYAEGMPEWPDHMPTQHESDEGCPFRLITPPAQNYLNTSFTETVTSQDKEICPTLKMHPEDARQLDVESGNWIRIGNDLGNLLIQMTCEEGQQRGVVVVESIWPNSAFREGLGINTLISAEPGKPAGGGTFHDCHVWIEKATD